MFLPLMLAVPLLVGVIATSAAQSPSATVAVEKPWARATPGKSTTGAVYMTLVDRATTPDRLIGVSSPVAARAQIHTAGQENGVMKMREVEALPVEPGKPIEFKPGGYHIMMLDLKQPLKEGDSVPVTLSFEKAGRVEVIVPVQKVGAMAPMPGMEPMSGMHK